MNNRYPRPKGRDPLIFAQSPILGPQSEGRGPHGTVYLRDESRDFFAQNKIALESLSMDLLRVAVGLNRGSFKMAETFQKEASKRLSEIESGQLKPYMKKVILQVGQLFKIHDNNQKAEYALMYSTLIRNYCTHYLTPDKQ